MSDTPPPPDAVHEANEALTRMAAYGRKPGSGRGVWGKLVLVIVLLVPLAAVGWVAWMQADLRNELAALRADNATLQQRSATSSSQFAEVQQRQQELDTAVQQTLEQELADANARLAAQAEQLAALETELEATRLRVDTMNPGGAPLAEAEVLLRFAQQRVVLGRDVTTATELLLSADMLLRDVTDPAAFAVRESLQRELTALQAVTEVDVAGLFSQLSAQAARIADFAVVSTASVQDFEVTPAGETPSAADAGWWSGVKQAFGEYFVVTQSTGELLPQLSASEQFQLRALVQLHIEQAKLALLRADTQLYQGALEDALDTSRRWLRSADGSLDEFIATLETLRDTPIVTELPPLGQTLSALRTLTGAAAPPPAAEPDSPPAAGTQQ